MSQGPTSETGSLRRVGVICTQGSQYGHWGNGIEPSGGAHGWSYGRLRVYPRSLLIADDVVRGCGLPPKLMVAGGRETTLHSLVDRAGQSRHFLKPGEPGIPCLGKGSPTKKGEKKVLLVCFLFWKRDTEEKAPTKTEDTK